MLTGERVQLVDDLGRSAEAQVGVDAPQRRREAEGLEARLLGVEEPVAVEPVQRQASPEGERRAQEAAGIRDVAGPQRLPAERGQTLELGDVERSTPDREHIAGRPRA